MRKSIHESNEPCLSHILGVDFGEAKIGLAIADDETKMAFAFDTLGNDKNLLSKLKEIADCENVRIVVIGMTAHEKDPESAKKKQAFGEEVAKQLGVEVFYQEEMFTTKMAQANMIAKGLRDVGKKDDAEAARIILQEWLDK